MTDLVETTLFRGEIARETDKAVCWEIGRGVTSFAGHRELWLPKSQITWVKTPVYGEVAHVPAWLAREVAQAFR